MSVSPGAAPAREPELTDVRRLAEGLASKRKERTTTAHLLAAIAARPGAAAGLLAERRLDETVLLQAARVVTDDRADAIATGVQRAREFAARSTQRDPSSLHLLFALCHERSSAAFRALEQCGVDVSKLRNSAMQLAMGLTVPRRLPPDPRAGTTLLPPSQPPSPLKAPPVAGSRLVAASPRIASDAALPSRRTSPPKPKRVRPTPSEPHAIRASADLPDPRRTPRSTLDPKSFPALSLYGRNLTLLAERHELEPIVGREEEVERVLDVLAKQKANNVCLVGPPGVGKSSIVRAVAERTARADAGGRGARSVDVRVLVELDPAALTAGAGLRGQMAERIAAIRAECRGAPHVVLVVDDLAPFFGAAADEETTQELRNAIAKGELVFLACATHEEYRKTIDVDGVLSRRFFAVEVCEPTNEEAVQALDLQSRALELHHAIKIGDGVVEAAVRFSQRYVRDRALPDKAAAVLDLAAARARRRGVKTLDVPTIAEVVSELADVPVDRLLETDHVRLLRLEAHLAERIVGHSAPLGRIAAVLRRNVAGFRARRPIGSFLLLGPTGVGKTETAKAVAEVLFGSDTAMTRLDFSEYAEAHAIARLIGAPPGYVGHEAGGQLTESVRRKPYQVILLDEIEKAHRDVLQGFLQVFDEGRLTDGRGKTVDFTNVVFFLTSNLGAEAARAVTSARGRIGFRGAPKDDAERTREGNAANAAMAEAARRALPPELYNRLDEVLVFGALDRSDVAEVARRLVASLSRDLEEARGITIDVAPQAIEQLLDLGGFDAELGARPMRRAIGRHIEAPIAEMILRGELGAGDIALVDASPTGLLIDAVCPSSRPNAVARTNSAEGGRGRRS